MRQPIIRGHHLRLLAKTFEINLVLIMNDYFRQGPDMGKCRPGASRVTPSFRFIRERLFAIPSFHQKCCPGALPPPLSGPWFQGRKNNGSLKYDRKLPTVKPYCKVTEVTIWFQWSKPHDVLVVKIASWNTTETRGMA